VLSDIIIRMLRWLSHELIVRCYVVLCCGDNIHIQYGTDAAMYRIVSYRICRDSDQHSTVYTQDDRIVF
jgi:hypothetical protein